jgi:hypothetical protein
VFYTFVGGVSAHILLTHVAKLYSFLHFIWSIGHILGTRRSVMNWDCLRGSATSWRCRRKGNRGKLSWLWNDPLFLSRSVAWTKKLNQVADAHSDSNRGCSVLARNSHSTREVMVVLKTLQSNYDPDFWGKCVLCSEAKAKVTLRLTDVL